MGLAQLAHSPIPVRDLIFDNQDAIGAGASTAWSAWIDINSYARLVAAKYGVTGAGITTGEVVLEFQGSDDGVNPLDAAATSFTGSFPAFASNLFRWPFQWARFRVRNSDGANAVATQISKVFGERF